MILTRRKLLQKMGSAAFAGLLLNDFHNANAASLLRKNKHNIQIEGNIISNNDEIILTYSLINNSTKTIAIVNQIPQKNIDHSISLASYNIYIQRFNSTIVFEKSLSSNNVHTGLVKLKPGETLTETIQLSLPLVFVHPNISNELRLNHPEQLQIGNSIHDTHQFMLKIGIFEHFDEKMLIPFSNYYHRFFRFSDQEMAVRFQRLAGISLKKYV